jgi:hypothetical protein
MQRYGILIRKRGMNKKYPALGKLAVEEWTDVVREPLPRPHATFHGMARRLGIKISVGKIGENLYRLARAG